MKNLEITLENGCVKKLFFKFAIPSIVGMLIVSVQTMVDGIFIANNVGMRGLAAVNLSMPYIFFLTSIALMITSGGSVIAGIYYGNNNIKKADETKSFTVLMFIAIIGLVSIFSMIFLKNIITFLGADDLMRTYVEPYLSIMIIFSIFYNFPIVTETFVRLKGKPNLVFLSGAICFLGNVILDYLFIIKMGWGMEGAAIATCIANVTGSLALIKFLDLKKPKGNFEVLKKILYNGSSEMLTLLSSSITMYIFNLVVMRNIGELGVSALTIVFYINSIVSISLYGLSQALQPIVSYNLGAQRFTKIYDVLKIATISGGAIGLISFILMKFHSGPIINIFSKGDKSLILLTGEVISYFSFAYIFSFINIISSSLHTAIEKPLESAFIACGHSIIFVVIALMILPLFLGNIGIWLAIPFGEFLCIILSIPLTIKSLKNIAN